MSESFRAEGSIEGGIPLSIYSSNPEQSPRKLSYKRVNKEATSRGKTGKKCAIIGNLSGYYRAVIGKYPCKSRPFEAVG